MNTLLYIRRLNPTPHLLEREWSDVMTQGTAVRHCEIEEVPEGQTSLFTTVHFLQAPHDSLPLAGEKFIEAHHHDLQPCGQFHQLSVCTTLMTR